MTDDGTFTFDLQTNLIEKLDGERRSRSKTTARETYTDRNTRVAADDTLVGMAVRSTHLA